jgi:hypothetical protein
MRLSNRNCQLSAIKSKPAWSHPSSSTYLPSYLLNLHTPSLFNPQNQQADEMPTHAHIRTYTWYPIPTPAARTVALCPSPTHLKTTDLPKAPYLPSSIVAFCLIGTIVTSSLPFLPLFSLSLPFPDLS